MDNTMETMTPCYAYNRGKCNIKEMYHFQTRTKAKRTLTRTIAHYCEYCFYGSWSTGLHTMHQCDLVQMLPSGSGENAMQRRKRKTEEAKVADKEPLLSQLYERRRLAKEEEDKMNEQSTSAMANAVPAYSPSRPEYSPTHQESPIRAFYDTNLVKSYAVYAECSESSDDGWVDPKRARRGESPKFSPPNHSPRLARRNPTRCLAQARKGKSPNESPIIIPISKYLLSHYQLSIINQINLINVYQAEQDPCTANII
jgi:hypothetical protein